jgi:hypothetical protein
MIENLLIIIISIMNFICCAPSPIAIDFLFKDSWFKLCSQDSIVLFKSFELVHEMLFNIENFLIQIQYFGFLRFLLRILLQKFFVLDDFILLLFQLNLTVVYDLILLFSLLLLWLAHFIKLPDCIIQFS